MKSSFKTIQIEKIIVGPRMRPADGPWISALAASIETCGLLQPILVAEAKGGFHLAAGAHRLEAIRLLGKKTIDARVFSGDDVPDTTALALFEATENVVRKDLSTLERAIGLLSLKTEHEKRNPSSKHGGTRRSQSNDNNDEFQVAIIATWSKRFTAEVADKCGLSERSIRNYIKIARDIDPEIRLKLFPTWLANHQSQLIALSEQTHIAQAKIFDLIFGADPQAKSVAEALELINGARKKSEQDKFYTGTINNWHRLTPKNKTAFLDLHKRDVEAYARKQGWLT